MSPLSGIISPLVTPLDDIDSLDHAGLERLLEHTVSGGVSGIFLLGTTGEGPSLSYRLRAELVGRACRQVAGRVPVLVAISDTSYTESVALAERVAEAGADFLVMAPPYYLVATQDDLTRYTERMHDAVPLPLFLYNMPSLTKLRFDADTVVRVSELPGVVGVKDSSGDLRYLEAIVGVTRRRTDFAVLVGAQHLLVSAMRAGASGGVCGGANLLPHLFVNLYRAAADGNWSEAEVLQQSIDALDTAFSFGGEPSSTYVRSLKAALAMRDICSALPALPLSPLPTGEMDRIRSAMAAAAADA
jgi:dihydrodipicolinate synthase/N-acetylneuraminate lyase